MDCLTILAFDTALTSCSAAVIRNGVILSEIFEDRSRGQAERLLPMCQEVCIQAGLDFKDLDAVAVTRGPGTFTGVRIGLAAARGMALALDRPLIGVTTLEVTARNFFGSAGKNFSSRIAVCHDARRSEVYMQLFDLKEGEAVPASHPGAIPLNEVEQNLEGRVVTMTGTGAEMVKPFLSQAVLERLDFPDMPTEANGGMAGLMAWEKLAGGDELADEVTPLYLRPPDAVAAKAVIYPFQNV